MKPINYFKKYGAIYGVSEKYAFGRWNGYAIEFHDFNKAIEWLNTEEYNFRTRTLCSKTYAKQYFCNNKE